MSKTIVTHLAIRYLIGGLFLLSGGLKIFSAHAFSVTIADVVPTNILRLSVLFGLPLLELAVGSSFITKYYYKASLITAMMLLIVFTVFIALFSGRSGSNCGCFGDVISVTYNIAGLVKNALLLAGVAYLAINHKPMSYHPMYHYKEEP